MEFKMLEFRKESLYFAKVALMVLNLICPTVYSGFEGVWSSLYPFSAKKVRAARYH